MSDQSIMSCQSITSLIVDVSVCEMECAQVERKENEGSEGAPEPKINKEYKAANYGFVLKSETQAEDICWKM